MRHRTPAADPALKRGDLNGYHLRANALITAGEALRLVDSRVALLVAHWEKERRDRVWHRRLRRWVSALPARLRAARG